MNNKLSVLRDCVKKTPKQLPQVFILYLYRTIMRPVYWLRYQVLLPLLHPISTEMKLIRFGPLGDGGYLIPDDLEGISACFSPGVASISGFEKDCADRNMKVYLADGSVDAPAESHPLFEFSKKFIGAHSKENYITLEEWVANSSVDKTSDLMMQMDIENFEWEVLDHASSELLQRFRIIVIEFHGMHRLNRIKYRVFKKLLESHDCIHIHPNNTVPSRKIFNLTVPPLMEFTFLRKDRVSNFRYCSNFPHPLDSDNIDKPFIPLPVCWYRQRNKRNKTLQATSLACRD